MCPSSLLVSIVSGAVLLVIGLLRGVLRREVSGSLFLCNLVGGFGVAGALGTANIHKVCFAAPKPPAPKTRLTKFTKNSGDNRGYKEKRLRRLRRP